MSEKTRQELGPHSDNQSSSLGDVPLNALDLSTRAYNRLRHAGYHTVAEIASLTDEQLLNTRQVGVTVLGEIREKLTVYLDRHPLSEPSRSPESLHTTQVHLSRNTLIGVLRLSIDSYNALWRDGVATIGQLAQMSSEQILSIQGVNEKSLAEIEGKLKAYLDERPPLAPELTAPTKPEPPTPLVDPMLLAHTAQVKRYATWLGEQGKANWSASPLPVPKSTSIKVLGLSIRAYNALMRGGVTTISQLAQMSSEQILIVRNVGGKSLVEIEEKLKAYLAEHPLPPTGPVIPVEPAPTIPVEPDPPPPLVDSALLARAAKVPLGDISVERLALPVHWRNQLRRLGIELVGELTQQTADAFGQDPLVENQLERYLTWLIEQDEAVWADEVAGRGISPLHRLALAETMLEDLIEKWLSSLKPKERQVVRWRYGLNGEKLTLEEAGERLDVTRSRVGQLQKRALRILRYSQPGVVIRPL